MTTSPRLRDESGFTLIELLIVMIILGILMAIAIPAFLGQKEKAIATEAKTNASLAQKAMETCAAGNILGVYNDANAPCTIAELEAIEPSLAATEISGRVAVSGQGVDTYTIESDTTPVNNVTATFTIAKTAAGVDRTCTPTTGNNMCTGTGVW